MGITKLMPLIREKAPGAVRERKIEAFTGRIVACDASMAIYQFVIATTSMSDSAGIQQLTDADGVPVAHLQGILNRTVMFLEKGIKPIWVFDGKPPDLKKPTLDQRHNQKEAAKKEMEEAAAGGDIMKAKKALARTTKITPQMTEDAKRLVKFLGVPMVEAATEAEAQCAALVKAGKAWATVSEDMDTLTFGSTYLLRNVSAKKKEPIWEISLPQVLRDFEMSQDEFIDLCILCGCDYLKHIEGVGPARAFKLIQEARNIEGALVKLLEENDDPKKKRKKKFMIPPNYEIYPAVRKFFQNPDVEDVEKMEFVWKGVDEIGLKRFLCDEKRFRDMTVEHACERIRKNSSKVNQQRLDSFFMGKRPQPSFKREATPEKKKVKSMRRGERKEPAAPQGRGNLKKSKTESDNIGTKTPDVILPKAMRTEEFDPGDGVFM